MQETVTDSPIRSESLDGNIVVAATQAEAWAGEPFLRPDEDAAVVLAAGTARRRALDDALAGILTELIAANQKDAENGNGALVEEVVEDEEEDEDVVAESDESEVEELPEVRHAPGAIRRYRFR